MVLHIITNGLWYCNPENSHCCAHLIPVTLGLWSFISDQLPLMTAENRLLFLLNSFMSKPVRVSLWSPWGLLIAKPLTYGTGWLTVRTKLDPLLRLLLGCKVRDSLLKYLGLDTWTRRPWAWFSYRGWPLNSNSCAARGKPGGLAPLPLHLGICSWALNTPQTKILKPMKCKPVLRSACCFYV